MLFAFVLVMAFLFGPLLPWSPLKPGYEVVRFAGADVYFSGHNERSGDYSGVDRIIREAEAFHRMKYLRRVELDTREVAGTGAQRFGKTVNVSMGERSSMRSVAATTVSTTRTVMTMVSTAPTVTFSDGRV